MRHVTETKSTLSTIDCSWAKQRDDNCSHFQQPANNSYGIFCKYQKPMYNRSTDILSWASSKESEEYVMTFEKIIEIPYMK